MAQFAQIPNETLRDDRLSYLARGILAEALSHAADWRHEGYKETRRRARHARGEDAESRDAIEAGYAELERHGYRHRICRRGERGRFAAATEIRFYAVPTACGDAECVTCRRGDRASGPTSEDGTSVQAAPEARSTGPSVPPGKTGSFRRSHRKPGGPGARSTGPPTEDHQDRTPSEHHGEDHAASRALRAAQTGDDDLDIDKLAAQAEADSAYVASHLPDNTSIDEENTADAMLGKGAHPRQVVNKVRADRRRDRLGRWAGDCLGRGVTREQVAEWLVSVEMARHLDVSVDALRRDARALGLP
jgi:ribosomal protein L13E